MDGFEVSVTSIAIFVIVILMVIFACHVLGPKASAWICSNREEKVGLSKSNLYNPNGYLIHSRSDVLLSSSGSFKRFDSIDRDYKQIGQTAITSPTWSKNVNSIPPQPLRPAPAPNSTNDFKIKLERPPIKQQSCDNLPSMIIPRPITRKQMSSTTPLSSSINNDLPLKGLIGTSHSSTNPFLNGLLTTLPEIDDKIVNIKNKLNTRTTDLIIMDNADTIKHMNPFLDDHSEIILDGCNLADQNNLLGNDLFNHSNVSTTQDSIKCNNISLDSLNKYKDSPCTNGSENILERRRIVNFRNRSFSETEALILTPVELIGEGSSLNNLNQSTNPFLPNHKEYPMINSTSVSSQDLARKDLQHSLVKQISSSNLFKSQIILNGDQQNGSISDLNIKRALSCDSVTSESSVILSDLEPTSPPATGQLCVGLQYDKNTLNDDKVELILIVMEAKQLILPKDAESFDTFIKVYLVPDDVGSLQTKVFKNSLCPTYNDTFCFSLNKNTSKRSLLFHLYHCGATHTLLGEAELEIVDLKRSLTTWLTLSDSKYNNSECGELMFSLSYLPTAERLTVVVVKARNLTLSGKLIGTDGTDGTDQYRNELQNIFVKVYLLKNDKKVSKKKTTIKRVDRSAVFNESMIFSVPLYSLQSVQIRLTVMNVVPVTEIIGNPIDSVALTPIGHVIVGGGTSGKELQHWNQMLTSLRKPIAMWHAIRKTNKYIRVSDSA